MKIMRLFVLAVVVVGMGISSVFAYHFGNPGKVGGRGDADLGLALDFGEREVEAESGGDTTDFDIQGLSIEGRYGLGNGLELRGRLIPTTVEWEAGDGDFSPNILGLGAGIQWVPGAQKSQIQWGFGLGFDYGKGDDSGVDLDYLDIELNGGVSYAASPKVDVYGGLSYINSNLTLEANGASADYEMDMPFGLFGGADLKLNNNWSLGGELRLMNETMVSLLARYAF